MAMKVTEQRQRFDTVVIGGGQAGLAVGYYLALQRRNFVILDAHARTGASIVRGASPRLPATSEGRPWRIRRSPLNPTPARSR